MTILSTFGGTSGVDTGDIGHSLRFRSGASAYLSRTFGTPTNQNVWAFSCWLKLSDAAAVYRTILGRNSTDLNYSIGPTNVMWCFQNGEGGQSTSALFREYTGFVHLCIRCVSSNSTEIYINNNLLKTVTSTNRFNVAGVLYYIGGSSSAGEYFGGYLSRVCFVDGTALTPSSFGYFNTEINEWVSKSQSAVKAVVDAGGTNSFMLDFDDATSLTTLGYDKSSKGNNWTLNNFSLTAGTTYDHMLDVPGNSFATLNPIGSTTTGSCANGNLQANTANTGTSTLAATMAVSSGKWYWEYVPTSLGIGAISGVIDAGQAIPSDPGASSLGYGYYSSTGNKENNGSFSAYGASYTTSDVIGVALDMDAGTLTFYKNGAGQGQAFSGLTGTKIPAFGDGGSGTTVQEINFGQAPLHASATYHSAAGGYFRYAPPTGFKALCQRNMPDPAILNPEKHFDVVTRTGTGASASITGLQFGPDFVWSKCRSAAVGNVLYDRLRGVQQYLITNSTGAEGTGSDSLTAFNADGYTAGADSTTNGINASAATYANWLWKMGGAGVTNTSGSITSTVSANVEAGQSIVTYTGTGANATVGHGLGKAPGLVIVKDRTAASANSWMVQHQNLTSAAYVLILNQTSAQSSAGTYFNSTFPTSSVFSVGTGNDTNQNAHTFVAYCFAEIPGFSKIFSYTGNGSADGPYVECGFKPKYVLVKRIDVAATWCVLDSVRNTYNVSNLDLYPNLSIAESGVDFEADFTGSGLKLRTTDAESNANGGTYIGIAFADVAGKFALGR